MADLTEKKYYAKTPEAKSWQYTMRRIEVADADPSFYLDVGSPSGSPMKAADVRALIAALEAALVGK